MVIREHGLLSYTFWRILYVQYRPVAVPGQYMCIYIHFILTKQQNIERNKIKQKKKRKEKNRQIEKKNHKNGLKHTFDLF